ncbi:helix-turn-helix transcriptional regulator [Paucibacter soli]|uniref:helix-turn-helix transcriptional regulator n=1 Tax=Paucibacter soli TaxID=3133433 RepID=UPI0030A9C559
MSHQTNCGSIFTDINQSILEVSSIQDMKKVLIRFANSLDCDIMAASAITDLPHDGIELITVDNTPTSYLEIYNDVESKQFDPICRHCKTQNTPIVWDQSTYANIGLGELWEIQAQYGYKSGMTIALHLGGGRHFMFGIDRDEKLLERREVLTSHVAKLQLFSVFAQESAWRLLTNRPTIQEEVHLTPREIDCLRWTMAGKTAWEVGVILGISERAVVAYIGNANIKLNCTSKYQSVLKAIQLGLIR